MPGATVGQSLKPFIEKKVKTLPKPLADGFATSVADVSESKPRSLDEFIAAGTVRTDEIILAAGENASAFRKELLKRMNDTVGVNFAANVTAYESRKGAANTVEKASKLLPDSWTKAIDAFGELYVRKSVARAFHTKIDGDYSGQLVNLKKIGFGIQPGDNNLGYIATRANVIETALHEYVHRVQSALPDLDKLFQDLHRRRTAGDSLKRLKNIYPQFNYRNDELTREDNYINAYFGKEYNGSAKEVMTMAIESVMSRDSPLNGSEHPFSDLLKNDRELFDLVIGVLFNYAP